MDDFAIIKNIYITIIKNEQLIHNNKTNLDLKT